jgi:Phage tail lysozyme
VLGALAAAPSAHDLLTSTAVAGHPATAQLTSPGQTGLGQPAGDPTDNAATFRTSIERVLTTATADARPKHRSRRRRVAQSAPRPSADPSSSPSPQPSSPGTGSMTCSSSESGGMLPENYAAIVNFLTAHGYTGLAAAGIAGNIWQESKGNPESEGDGGGGLIGWTPLPDGFVTGNPTADLQTQLEALLTYNQGWAQFIPALNAATSAVQAADIYMDDFERPGNPQAGNREAAAEAVAAACGL